MTDQEQWKQDFERARHYREALDEIAGMKIPYVDAYDVANNMRCAAKEAIADFMPEESHLWARIAELEVCIRQMCNNALDLGYCDMRDCTGCKTFKCGGEMNVKLRGRSRANGKDLFYHNAIAEIYHHVNDGCLMGFAGYDPDTEKPILLDIELWTGFTDGEGNEFWEHDTVRYPAWGEHDIFTIVWDEEKGCWSLENDNAFFPMAPIVHDLVRCGA